MRIKNAINEDFINGVHAFEKLSGSAAYIKNFLDALPNVAAILNSERQIVYSNNTLLKGYGTLTIEELLGKRQGDLLNCNNSWQGSCGESDFCKLCGALRAIEESKLTKHTVKEEFRVTSKDQVSYEFLVSAAPFYFENNNYTILTLTDISHEKRRRALEKIFFHDLINRAGSLSGFVDIINNNHDPDNVQDYLKIIRKISEELIEEILAQKALLAAENNELHLEMSDFFSLDFLSGSVNEIMYHKISEKKHVSIDSNSINHHLRTDRRLLRRIITNMLKNAFEASKENEVILAGCDLTDGKISFWVHNITVMSLDTKMQVFQRSFSTKGINRGLGTYRLNYWEKNI